VDTLHAIIMADKEKIQSSGGFAFNCFLGSPNQYGLCPLMHMMLCGLSQATSHWFNTGEIWTRQTNRNAGSQTFRN